MIGRNEHVEKLKTSPWTSLVAMLGAHGYLTMLELVLGCGVFLPVAKGSNTVYQASGRVA